MDSRKISIYRLTGRTGHTRINEVKVVPSYEAKSKFSEILRAAAGGESFVITCNGKRMAELRPCQGPEIRRKQGMMREQFGPVREKFHGPLEGFGDS